MTSRWQVAADDPPANQRGLVDMLSRTENPRHRMMLQTLIRHDQAEIDCDLDAVMSTMSPDAAYIRWGPTGDTGPKGTDEIRAHYVAMFEGGGIGNLTAQHENVLIDDHAVLMEYRLSRIVPWRLAKDAGYSIAEEQGHYALHSHFATVVTFDDECRVVRETSYGSTMNPRDCERVPDDELSPGYLAWQQRFAPDI